MNPQRIHFRNMLYLQRFLDMGLQFQYSPSCPCSHHYQYHSFAIRYMSLICENLCVFVLFVFVCSLFSAQTRQRGLLDPGSNLTLMHRYLKRHPRPPLLGEGFWCDGVHWVYEPTKRAFAWFLNISLGLVCLVNVHTQWV